MLGRLAAALLCASAFAGSLAGRAAEGAEERPQPRLIATGEAQTVFRWHTDRCNADHYPDSPARALRTPDGGVMVLAAHFTNTPLLGPDFDSLRPACEERSRGAESPDPEAFDDRFWVQAVVPLRDGRVLGLASHEYMGARHAGRCDVVQGRRHLRCWYSSITATAAEPGSWRFRPLPFSERVVAASPVPYDPSTSHRTGFFSTTNIVTDQDFAYFLVYVEGVPGQRNGMCLLRAPRADLLTGWRALAGGSFGLHLGAAPRSDQPCDVVGDGVFRGAVRSLVKLGPGGPWVAVFAAGGGPGAATPDGLREGIFYSVSPDLRRWSAPALLLELSPYIGHREPGVYFQYPSLIDHASPSPVFDEAGGRLHLYLTRFNFGEGRRSAADRDLVRFPVAVER